MRILVVDDEERFADGLRRGLAAEGFAVDVARDGAEGLWAAREVRYDAIVLDVMMPGVDGYGVCARLRAAGVWTPVLLLTARDAAADQVRGLDAGADDYVVKPVEFPVLLARLRALVRRGAPERPVAARVGSLVVDPATRQVQRAGRTVALTGREYAVLEFLARRPGTVVTKVEVLDGVWDGAFEGDPNIVEVYVGRLRAKIDRPFGVETLLTVRGAGYRLVPDA